MQLLRFIFLPALLLANTAFASGQRFDGSWNTTLTCPAKGNTEGYTWHFVSVIQNNVLQESAAPQITRIPSRWTARLLKTAARNSPAMASSLPRIRSWRFRP